MLFKRFNLKYCTARLKVSLKKTFAYKNISGGEKRNTHKPMKSASRENACQKYLYMALDERILCLWLQLA